VTAIQLVHAFSALANNGRLAPLTLIKTDKAPQTTQVLPEAVAKTMQGMLQQVIEARAACSVPGAGVSRGRQVGYCA
jgi:cell division protein FtsI (penicillin-binding protein 3)